MLKMMFFSFITVTSCDRQGHLCATLLALTVDDAADAFHLWENWKLRKVLLGTSAGHHLYQALGARTSTQRRYTSKNEDTSNSKNEMLLGGSRVSVEEEKEQEGEDEDEDHDAKEEQGPLLENKQVLLERLSVIFEAFEAHQKKTKAEKEISHIMSIIGFVWGQAFISNSPNSLLQSK